VILFDCQPREVRGRQFEVLSKHAIVAPQLGIAGDDSGMLGSSGRICVWGGRCSSDLTEFLKRLRS
jgi:hypothetical protein